MAVGKETLFDRFLAPIFRNLIDRDAIDAYYHSRDWETASQQFCNPQVDYPDYYQQNFHGIQGGYLNLSAAFSYDPIVQYVLPPGESIVRSALIDRITSQPRRILDLGCGTGSTTLKLKQAFPQAEVVGLDLSPYMLVVAQDKAQTANLDISFCHGLAEATGFPAHSFDLVTASLLFHELPPAIARDVLRESFRLLRSGGEVLILDGNQPILRSTPWLMEVFEEPHIKAFAQNSLDADLSAIGFDNVETEAIWLVHQITRGVKPIVGRVQFEAIEPTAEAWAMG
ncbi:class I SAM-dependent methyltransferase [Microcoleus sp. FACHB-1515]|uniref:class I SAM-dependent methyltransferase n=1 Tax=Cyanophyceae TaxID=3028117 RepID=UPI0016836826|nr:class I SAM-dependent methyltransferase [Microcoleus sp. FACHB-1515]MBD2088614.1 class I SAM-dependent methyltransferase [Microcoleus sp. FACHB-1515]